MLNKHFVDHEFGHALSLKHPDKYNWVDYGPFCKQATAGDTVMSYQGIDSGFTDSDIEIINRIWTKKYPSLAKSCVESPQDFHDETYQTYEDGFVNTPNPLVAGSDTENCVIPEILPMKENDDQYNLATSNLATIGQVALMALAFVSVVKKLLRPNAKTNDPSPVVEDVDRTEKLLTNSTMKGK